MSKLKLIVAMFLALTLAPASAATVRWATDGWAIQMIDKHIIMIPPKVCTVGPLPKHDVVYASQEIMRTVATSNNQDITLEPLGLTVYPPVAGITLPTEFIRSDLSDKLKAALIQHEDAHLRGCRHDYDAKHRSWLLEFLVAPQYTTYVKK